MSEQKSEKIKLKERPLSPHLTIYKPQITSVLSITHRATGVFLFLGAFIFVWELSAFARGGDAFECYMGFATSWLGIFIAFFWVLSLFYHLFNGIRHIFWDMGLGFDIKTAALSGALVVIATVITTIYFFYLFYKA